ncbi:MAG: hypothetical protein ACJ75J_10080 [Cytophagaceae bacterium]
MPLNHRLLLITAIYFLSFPLAAQNYNGNSLYSRPGLGEILPFGNIRNIGMGGMGLSTSNVEFINNINPALLHSNLYLNTIRKRDSSSYIPLRPSIFDGAMIGVLQNSATSSVSQTNLSSTFSYFSYAVPLPFTGRLKDRWTINAGLQQFTKVSYKTSFTEAISGGAPGDSANLAYSGSGGLYQAYLGNGIDITKNISVGLQLSYIFGNRKDESNTQIIIPPSQQSQLVYSQKTNHNAIQIKPGVAYRTHIFTTKATKRIKDSTVAIADFDNAIWAKRRVEYGDLILKKRHKDIQVIKDSIPIKETVVVIKRKKRVKENDEPVYFNIGLVYDYFAAVHGKQTTSFEKRDSLNRVLDSSPLATSYLKVTIPSVYRAGISFDKPDNWVIGTDFSYSPWSAYSGFDSSTTFTNSYSIALGGEKTIVPRYNNNKKFQPSNRLFRAGVNYTKMPFTVDNRQVKDISVSLGSSVGLGSKKNSNAKLNFALVGGHRGTTANGSIRELYLKVYLGIVVRDFWFRKSQVD